MSCQSASGWRASSPMMSCAAWRTRSGEPPSPRPVMPASVSTVTMWKLWLIIGRLMGEW